MARIEHIALWVDDLDALSTFYGRAFGAQVGPRYVNALKGFESCFLTFESGTPRAIGSRSLRDESHRLSRYERGDAPVLRAKNREK